MNTQPSSYQEALNSIKRETLANVAARIRPRSRLFPFQLAAIDELLAEIDPPLLQGDILNVHGGTCSGKSELVQYMIMTLIAPKSQDSIPMTGQNIRVLLLDTQYRVNVTNLHDRLAQYARNCALQHGQTPPHDWSVRVAREWIEARLSVYYVSDHMDLVAIMHMLSVRPGGLPGFLIIDSLSSIMFPFKSSNTVLYKDYLSLSKLVARYLNHLKMLGVTCILTTWDLLTPITSDATAFEPTPPVILDRDQCTDFDVNAAEKLGYPLDECVDVRLLLRREHQRSPLALVSVHLIRPWIPKLHMTNCRFFQIHNNGLLDYSV